jgi:hypothetical protein
VSSAIDVITATLIATLSHLELTFMYSSNGQNSQFRVIETHDNSSPGPSPPTRCVHVPRRNGPPFHQGNGWGRLSILNE